MIANHIHDALRQVRQLQEFILEKRLFKGYSGKARIICGTVALAGAAVLASDAVPNEPTAHLVGWGVVLFIGVVLNYACLLYWFLFNPEVRRNPVMLKPALDAIPGLGVGAVFTLVFVLGEQFDMLFGMWMCLYGLAQVAYRQSLPQAMYLVGVGYVLCGALCLLAGPVSFTNPWPMGIVFFAGELTSGAILMTHKTSAGEQP
ncbi:hypothetical protein ACFLSJ_02710 [Verrucomicrobiota bacterium]